MNEREEGVWLSLDRYHELIRTQERFDKGKHTFIVVKSVIESTTYSPWRVDSENVFEITTDDQDVELIVKELKSLSDKYKKLISIKNRLMNMIDLACTKKKLSNSDIEDFRQKIGNINSELCMQK